MSTNPTPHDFGPFAGADWLEIANTHLQGLIHTTYAELVGAFGEPLNGPDDPDLDKDTCEWVVMLPFGVATIYDKARGYFGGHTPRDCWDWHIGGHSPDVVDAIVAKLSGTTQARL